MLIYRGWVPPFSLPRGLGESNQLKEGIRGAVVTPGIEVTPPPSCSRRVHGGGTGQHPALLRAPGAPGTQRSSRGKSVVNILMATICLAGLSGL